MHPKHVEKLIESARISPEEREVLSTKLKEPEPGPQVAAYNPKHDEELEYYLTRILLPRHQRPADYWPSLETVVGRLYAVLGFGALVGYWPETAESSISDMLAVLASTKNCLIARKASGVVRDLIEPRYGIPEELRVKAAAALAKYQERFPENGQVEVTDGR